MLRVIGGDLATHEGVYDFIFCDPDQEADALPLLARDGLLAVIGDVPELSTVSGLYVKLIPTFSGFNIPTTVSMLASKVPIPEMFGKARFVYDGPACLHQFSWITLCGAVRILACGSRCDKMASAYRQQSLSDWCRCLNFVALRQ